MDSQDVAVATITWVRSAEEEPIIRRSMQRLSRLGLPVAVADRGADRGFAAFLRGVDAFHVVEPPEPGLIQQVTAAVNRAAAFGTRFIMYTEPDKEEFFAARMTEFIRQAPGAADVGVVLASRSPESFATYPRIQRYTETIVNDLCGEFVGSRGDFSYGPFLMNRALLTAVSQLDRKLGWGWRPFVFRSAHRLALRVALVEADHPCPPQQYSDDDAERIHRLRQLSENILGLIA